jgi:cation:H+ antiporter
VEILLPDLIVNVLIICVSLLALNWASNLTIHNAVKVSTVTQLGKTAVGFSMLAFSTSLPELTVAFIAAFSGGAPVSVGNILGSNIANVCVVVGLAAVILGFRRPRGSNRSDGSKVIPSFAREELSSIYFGLLMSSVIPLVLIYVAQATWFVGLVLISIFVVYMYQLMKVRIPSENGETVTHDERNRLKRYVAFTVLGALGVAISAYFLVESAVTIAQSAGIPETVIGATIIAFGTSLPELTLDLKSFLKGHPALAFGDIIGSSFVNITLILGITLFLPALLGAPVVMNMIVYQNLVIFSIITNLFFWYFLSQAKLSWREGVLFLFIYLLFLITTLGFI